MELERNPKVSTTTPTAIHDVSAVEKEEELSGGQETVLRGEASVRECRLPLGGVQLLRRRYCNDVEVYVETVVLMHCEDLKARLCYMGEGFLKF
ncbi:unnamed protein product [Sphenostylis stenocarpa]|uniref:Uncharacterized protein n=1 Tax=Sphenostylis stenocarpa TaxID=92480 RepID=A0AA86SJ89_9FABA|nr:unnamed protein product [Sphenostylis stenocarpa]